MLQRFVFPTVLMLAFSATPLLAQSPKVEFSVLGGWTLSDGVSGDPVLALDGSIYDRIDPKDSFSWGLDLGVLVGEHAQVGFLYGRQESTLLIDGSRQVEIGDMPVTTYHGYIGYNFGDSDAPVRPYIFGGLGATSYGSVAFTGLGGQARETGGETQFSTTWGAGVKIFPSPNFGVRFGARFTPTYIKSDAAGWWCDPYWGCYVLSDAQYSNQLQFNGGVTFRF